MKQKIIPLIFAIIGIVFLLIGGFQTYKSVTTRVDLLPRDVFHTDNRSNVIITDVKAKKGISNDKKVENNSTISKENN